LIVVARILKSNVFLIGVVFETKGSEKEGL